MDVWFISFFCFISYVGDHESVYYNSLKKPTLASLILVAERKILCVAKRLAMTNSARSNLLIPKNNKSQALRT